MDLKHFKWAWKQPMKGNDKLVLLAIALHADAVINFWPGFSYIIQQTHLSRSTVFRAVNRIKALGFLKNGILITDH